MSLMGETAVAALFDNRDPADEAWGLLAAEGIPATVITQPEMLGAYQVSVVVDRKDLDRATEVLAPFINRPP
ncbi:MAG: hypothetical protein ACR2N7_09820 [Acidimicrobiia bacterium]